MIGESSNKRFTGKKSSQMKHFYDVVTCDFDCEAII